MITTVVYRERVTLLPLPEVLFSVLAAVIKIVAKQDVYTEEEMTKPARKINVDNEHETIV